MRIAEEVGPFGPIKALESTGSCHFRKRSEYCLEVTCFEENYALILHSYGNIWHRHNVSGSACMHQGGDFKGLGFVDKCLLSIPMPAAVVVGQNRCLHDWYHNGDSNPNCVVSLTKNSSRRNIMSFAVYTGIVHLLLCLASTIHGQKLCPPLFEVALLICMSCFIRNQKNPITSAYISNLSCQ